MKVFFRCKRSGNTVSFTNEDDIAQLRKHEGYEEVIESPAAPNTEQPTQDTPKQRGRPRKGN